MFSFLDQISEFPLCWPEDKPRSAARKRSAFKSSLAKALREAEEEMRRFRASGFVISMNPLHRRARGGDDPAVALWFTMRGERGAGFDLRVIACDSYTSREENLHAIVLTLDALRAIERYGAYSLAQAIEGAKQLALPEPDGGWRQMFGDLPADLDAADKLAMVEGRYRRAAAAASAEQDEARLVQLNAAIHSAREELKRAP